MKIDLANLRCLIKFPVCCLAAHVMKNITNWDTDIQFPLSKMALSLTSIKLTLCHRGFSHVYSYSKISALGLDLYPSPPNIPLRPNCVQNLTTIIPSRHPTRLLCSNKTIGTPFFLLVLYFSRTYHRNTQPPRIAHRVVVE